MPETSNNTPKPRHSRKKGSAPRYTAPLWLLSLRRIHTVPFHAEEQGELLRAEEMTDATDPGLLWDGADDEEPDELARPSELRNHLLYLHTLALADLHKQGVEQTALLRSIDRHLGQLRLQGKDIAGLLEEGLDIFTELARNAAQLNEEDDDDEGDDGDGDAGGHERSLGSDNDGKEPSRTEGASHVANAHFEHPVAVEGPTDGEE